MWRWPFSPSKLGGLGGLIRLGGLADSAGLAFKAVSGGQTDSSQSSFDEFDGSVGEAILNFRRKSALSKDLPNTLHPSMKHM